MLTAPVDHPLDLVTQNVLTYASWVLTFVVLGIAAKMGRDEKTPFYVLMVLAALVGAFGEPLYDAAMMLYFYSGPAMHTHFTAFDIPQPVWTHSGYVVLYALPAIFVARAISRGTATRRTLYIGAAVELAMSCTFEMFGINGLRGGAYTYWGPHVFRIFEYPLAIGVLEAAQVVCFAVGATLLRRLVSRPAALLGLFALFPCTFFLVNCGAGAAMIVSLHLENTTPAIVAVGSLISMGIAVWLIRAAASLLPNEMQAPALLRAPA